jgi:hypothetical protein
MRDRTYRRVIAAFLSNTPQKGGNRMPAPGVLEALVVVAGALVEPLPDGSAPTYPQAAARAGVPLGTLHTRLARVKAEHPEAYGVVMDERRRQLAERHRRALERQESRSRAWHRRQANRRHYRLFGFWPWERRTAKGG